MFKSLATAVLLLGGGVAAANPRALPMTYTTDTLPAGQVEIEQFTDMTVQRAIPVSGAGNGKPQEFLATQYQQEIEIGITDRLELGLYFVYVPSRADEYTDVARMPEDTGIKQRLRYVLADPGEWPIDVGVYGELTESQREIEYEGKILLQRRFDKLRVAANIVAEYETYFDHTKEIVWNPSAGATYEVTPKFHAGLDAWSRAEYPQLTPTPARIFGLGPQYYAGPALMYNFGKLWWSVGAYLRVSDMNHDVQPGELYGRVWIRSMIGYNL